MNILSLFDPHFEMQSFGDKKHLFAKKCIGFQINTEGLIWLSRRYVRSINKALVKKLKELGGRYYYYQHHHIEDITINLCYLQGCGDGSNSEFSWDIIYPPLVIRKAGIVVRERSSEKIFLQKGCNKIVEQVCKVAEEIVKFNNVKQSLKKTTADVVMN